MKKIFVVAKDDTMPSGFSYFECDDADDAEDFAESFGKNGVETCIIYAKSVHHMRELAWQQLSASRANMPNRFCIFERD